MSDRRMEGKWMDDKMGGWMGQRNGKEEKEWERRMDGLFCTYYCIRTFAFLDEIVPCLKSVCLSAH